MTNQQLITFNKWCNATTEGRHFYALTAKYLPLSLEVKIEIVKPKGPVDRVYVGGVVASNKITHFYV